MPLEDCSDFRSPKEYALGLLQVKTITEDQQSSLVCFFDFRFIPQHKAKVQILHLEQLCNKATQNAFPYPFGTQIVTSPFFKTLFRAITWKSLNCILNLVSAASMSQSHLEKKKIKRVLAKNAEETHFISTPPPSPYTLLSTSLLSLQHQHFFLQGNQTLRMDTWFYLITKS